MRYVNGTNMHAQARRVHDGVHRCSAHAMCARSRKEERGKKRKENEERRRKKKKERNGNYYLFNVTII